MAKPIDRLAAKIALLSLVNNKPEDPRVTKSGEYTGAQVIQPRRTLTFKHEISITQHFAFICAYSEDPLHVVATCIEETIPRNCLIIRVAANTGTHETLLNGLEEISRILQNEATNG